MQSTQENKKLQEKISGRYDATGIEISTSIRQFRRRITRQEKERVWMLINANLEYTNALSTDLIIFIMHPNCYADWTAAKNLALRMTTLYTKYGQSKRRLRRHGLSLSRKDYYNLQQSAEKQTSETELH